jgi:hypothetical protein
VTEATTKVVVTPTKRGSDGAFQTLSTCSESRMATAAGLMPPETRRATSSNHVPICPSIPTSLCRPVPGRPLLDRLDAPHGVDHRVALGEVATAQLGQVRGWRLSDEVIERLHDAAVCRSERPSAARTAGTIAVRGVGATNRRPGPPAGAPPPWSFGDCRHEAARLQPTRSRVR